MSHVDYCNASLCNLPNIDISRFQVIQDMCAKLVKATTKYTSNDEALCQLRWLPVQQRIKFKILTLVHKYINCKAPTYPRESIDTSPMYKTRSLITINGKKTGCPKGTQVNLCGKIIQPCGTHLVEPTTEQY